MIIPSPEYPELEKKVRKAGTELVLRLPFFGYLLFGVAVKVRVLAHHSTMATNGVEVFWGPGFVTTEPLAVVTFGLLHELLHVYHDHVGRRGSRDKKWWNIAVDIYTNTECSLLLSEHGKPWPIPQVFVQPQPWALGLTAEQIYEKIKKEEEEDPGSSKQYLPEGGDEKSGLGDASDMDGCPEPPTDSGDPCDPQDSASFQETFRQDVSTAKALMEQSFSAQELPDKIKERMQKVLRPTLPWGSLLRGQLCDAIGWDTLSYAPPKLKYYPLILPQVRALQERVLLLGIDVSASVTDELIRIFISNTEAAAQRATATVVVTFDQVMRERYRTTRPRDIFANVHFRSGWHSHTSAMCVFEVAKEVRPSAICVLTDGYIVLPEKPVSNTTFVIPQGGQTPPWGRTFVMEHPWR